MYEDSPFGPIVKHWLAKIEFALEYKKKAFQDDADEAARFYNGPYDFMYEAAYRSGSRGFKVSADIDMPAPSFQMSVNKVAELVQIYGPVLYHRNPTRRVTPKETPDIAGLMMQHMGPMMMPDPMTGMMDPMAMQMQMQMQQSQMQSQMQRGEDSARALLYESYLSRTPYVLDLKTESRRAIDEALLFGMGCLWPELYQPPGANFRMAGSFFDSVYNLVIDPDADTLSDAKWIARKYVRPLWQVAQEYGLPEEALQGALESYDSAAGAHSDVKGQDRRRRGKTNDLVVYWRVYSKMGFGSLLEGIPRDMHGQLEYFGQFCHLAVCKGVPFFLNLTPDVTSAMPPEQLTEFVGWPTPYWADDGWPFVPIYFHGVPREVWPMSHIKPAMGELKFLNWAYSFLAGKIRTACRDFIAVLKSAGEELKKTILRGTDYEFIELERVHGDTIGNVVQFLQHPQFHGDIWKVIQAVEMNFEKRTGLTELSYGQSPFQMRSASEAQIKSDQLKVRPDDMANKVEESMSELGRREMLLARWHLQGQDVAPILGQDAAMWWDRLIANSDPAQTLHALDCRVEAGSVRKPNHDRDAQNMDQAMPILFTPFWGYAQMTGNVGPVNALISQWCKTREIDPGPFLIPVPPPPMPAPGEGGGPPGANPSPDEKVQEQMNPAA